VIRVTLVILLPFLVGAVVAIILPFLVDAVVAIQRLP
jgi:hypothetical protein